jgi:aryl-alcohol dehydrogenase-like predicted oxidoreductase
MQYARLGSSGLKVSRIGLGMMSYGDPASQQWVLREDDRAADFDVVGSIADRRGVPPARVALAWLLGKPGVTAPIVGATRPGHLADAVAAVDVVLTGEEVSRLEAPYLPRLVTSYS